MNIKQINKSETFGGLTFDVVFKKFFTEKVDIVSILLSEILNIDIRKEDITFINIEHTGETKTKKSSYIDLEVKLSSGEEIIIEMQNGYGEDFSNRIQYYTYKVIGNQLDKGETYKKLKKVYCICFLSGKDRSEINQFPNLFTNEVLYDRISKEERYSLPEFFYINLEHISNDNYGFSKFALDFFELMNIKRKDTLYNMETNDEFIKRSIDYIKKINNDPIIKAELDKELFDELAYNTDIEEATNIGIKQGIKQGKEEGIKQGKEQGIKQGIKQGKEEGLKEKEISIAQNMLNKDMDINLISELTGLSIIEIQNI